MHIMSPQQMAELRGWLQEQQTGVSLLVSPVPVLLPPCIGLAEYLAGVRLWTPAIAPLRWLGRQLTRLQLNIADRAGFEHWPVYATSWAVAGFYQGVDAVGLQSKCNNRQQYRADH